MNRSILQRARAVTATLGCGALLVGTLAGCVTNEEQAHPEGWEPIHVDAVPEIAAMVPKSVDDGVLNVGTNPPFAPFQLKDSDGSIIGVEMDLANAMAQVMGLEFEAQEQDFSMILPAVSQGQLDMGASGFTDNEERRANFDFVDTLYAGIQWAQLKERPIDTKNICGLKVAVQRTTVSETDDVRPKSEECVARGEEPIEILAYDTADNAALALLMGRADALSADSPVAAWAVARSDGKMELTGEVFDAAPYGIAVPKGSPLGPVAAAALQHLIDDGTYAQILAQWGIEDGLVDEAMINERPARV